MASRNIITTVSSRCSISRCSCLFGNNFYFIFYHLFCLGKGRNFTLVSGTNVLMRAQSKKPFVTSSKYFDPGGGINQSYFYQADPTIGSQQCILPNPVSKTGENLFLVFLDEKFSFFSQFQKAMFWTDKLLLFFKRNTFRRILFLHIRFSVSYDVP